MKLAECKKGTLVCLKPGILETDKLIIGHVIYYIDMSIVQTPGYNTVRPLPEEPINRIWPVVSFINYRAEDGATHGNAGTLVDYEDLDFFTAY